MNEYDSGYGDDYASALGEWVNEDKPANAKPTKAAGNKTVSAEKPWKTTAELYKFCQAEVLKQLAKTPDCLGRSQMWKVDAIKEDIANKRSDSAVMEWLAKEVATMADSYLEVYE